MKSYFSEIQERGEGGALMTLALGCSGGWVGGECWARQAVSSAVSNPVPNSCPVLRGEETVDASLKLETAPQQTLTGVYCAF